MASPIQWFPGHMAKASREIEDKLKVVDIVLELVDARIPLSSINPMLEATLKNKPKLIIINKADMADSSINKKWVEYFDSLGIKSILVDSSKGVNVNKITSLCKEILKEKIEKEKARGIKERSIRTMVLGIPNVGKSTLINKLAGRNSALTGNKPGVTKAQQWIRINKDLDLLDTPGILWPKFEDVKTGYHLALTGAIKDDIYNRDDMILYFMDFLKENYREGFESRYNVSLEDDKVENLNKIAKSKMYIRGDIIEYERVYDLILNDFRKLNLGHITIERP